MRVPVFPAVLVALLLGCVDEVVLPDSPPVSFVVMDTPRGTPVFVPPFLEVRRDHLLLAMDQIDETMLWSSHPNWAVRVVLPGSKPSVNKDTMELVIGWRPPHHSPQEDMLPGIGSLVKEVQEGY